MYTVREGLSGDLPLSDIVKANHDQVETIRTVKVEPRPPDARTESGIVLDSRGVQCQSILRVAEDGHTVLLPQPTTDPNDPLNWSWLKKHLILFTIAWAALCVDFTSAIGATVIFPQAEQWQMSSFQANEPNALNILFAGIGGLFWVPLSSIWGRAPVLFWTTILGLIMLVGTAVSPTYECYFAMRILTGLFLTSGQTMVLAFIKDMFFFHERARKIGLWATLYIASPYLGPCIGNFVIFETGHWPDIYWLCVGVAGFQVVLILLCVDETWYNREVNSQSQPARPQSYKGRFLRLTGLWQLQDRGDYFPGVEAASTKSFITITRPVVFLMCLSYLVIFAWAIGINISTTQLFAEPQTAGGYGYTDKNLGLLYFTPIVVVFLGEVFGHFFNDYLALRHIRRHRGIFVPEARIWMIYLSIVLMTPALVIVGQALQHHLHVTAVIFGWGMFVVGCMTMTVAVTAYTLDAYPMASAEIGGWINFSRTIGGFSVGFFQTPWAEKLGADVSFGTQAATVAVAAIPVLLVHICGRRLRRKFAGVH